MLQNNRRYEIQRQLIFFGNADFPPLTSSPRMTMFCVRSVLLDMVNMVIAPPGEGWKARASRRPPGNTKEGAKAAASVRAGGVAVWPHPEEGRPFCPSRRPLRGLPGVRGRTVSKPHPEPRRRRKPYPMPTPRRPDVHRMTTRCPPNDDRMTTNAHQCLPPVSGPGGDGGESPLTASRPAAGRRRAAEQPGHRTCRPLANSPPPVPRTAARSRSGSGS